MSSSFVLNQNALQIDQSIGAAYSGLVLAGTGLVRTNGDQNISGKKTFHGAVDFTGSSINLTGVSSFVPFFNASTDVGSSSKMFKTGFFSGVTGFNGYFQNLTVENLTTSLVPSLVGVTGKDMTLSGVTNIATANVSGNLGVTGNLSVTGATILSSSVSLLGTVYATGNKTFSGVFNQSGDVNIYGKTLVSGNSSFTGNVNVTGNLSVVGNQNITGKFTHTGEHFIDSNNTSFTFTGGGANHFFKIFAPTLLSGTVYHTGNLFRNGNSTSIGNIWNTGDISNTGSFENIGTFNLYGSAIINTGTSINFNANPKFNSGASFSGDLTTPSLRINPNLVSNPSGGAIEYSRGQFFATNELTGTPTRALINQTYSFYTQAPFFTGSGVFPAQRILGNTGIYLNTGIYSFEYRIRLNSKAVTTATAFGISGNGNNFANHVSHLMSATVANQASTTVSGRTSNTASSIILLSGAVVAIDGNNHYNFKSTFCITGVTKVYPMIAFNAAPTAKITGSAFDITINHLSTGTGNPTFNGPWSDS
jgi:hypothetical protein